MINGWVSHSNRRSGIESIRLPPKPQNLGGGGVEEHWSDLAVGQNPWYQFGVGASPILVYFSGDWDVHWGYGMLTHGHIVD